MKTYDTHLDNRDPSLAADAADESLYHHLREVVYDMGGTVDHPESVAFLDEVRELLPRFSRLPEMYKFGDALRDALDNQELDANAFLKSVTGRV